jgi:DNA-binding transcriptional ArsR family regulator
MTSILSSELETELRDGAEYSPELDQLMRKARKASNFLKALSHENRLLLLCLLAERERSVTELENILSLRQSAVSQQLARLRYDGMVDTRRDGKTIHIYGASTKGNTILQWCGLDGALIPYAADRNPDKSGARTLGTDIAIVSEEESRAMKPDYYLVLPWHFRKEFIEREAKTILAGTKFIFPLPEIEIVGAEQLAALAKK